MFLTLRSLGVLKVAGHEVDTRRYYGGSVAKFQVNSQSFGRWNWGRTSGDCMIEMAIGYLCFSSNIPHEQTNSNAVQSYHFSDVQVEDVDKEYTRIC